MLDRLIRMKDRVKIPQRYAHCTLDGYEPLNFSQTRALAEVCRIATRYPAVDRDLFLAGPPGVGKTHLAVGLVRRLMPRLSEDALFVDAPEMCRICGSGGNGREGATASWDRLVHSAVLILDNFGLAHSERGSCDLVQRLLLSRWRLRRFTIFTGDRVRPGAFVSAGTGYSASATQDFLVSLPPDFLLTFLTRVRFLSLVGEDFRRGNGQAPHLFETG